ncbi:hypothetical protein [Actinoplanes siamensis]|uniref:Uncharacterized protein n=1 Tax=Actinoplanes siamensis TaxID=1223317 RepID=A0A919N971_9ACTN|nr:hypothetical protein [Actinoplanes siamensis]GIF06560.1 hypothetical protein Asi03nite_40980 [Actinoplanes siamensis]
MRSTSHDRPTGAALAGNTRAEMRARAALAWNTAPHLVEWAQRTGAGVLPAQIVS